MQVGTIPIKAWKDELKAAGEAAGLVRAEEEWWAQVAAAGYQRENGAVVLEDNTFTMLTATKPGTN